MNELLKTKTFWTGVAGLITAIAAYCTGEMNAGAAIQTGIGSLMAIFLRDGMRK